jgi:hypothetical protein
VSAVRSSLLVGLALAACDGPPAPTPTGEPFPRCADHDPLRRVLWGDLHVHTALSLDANTQATRLGPEDAWRFARGEAVGIQPFDDAGNPLRTVQLDRPLDFAAVTDHAEFLGTIGACYDPASAAYDDAGCALLRDQPATAFLSLNALTAFEPARAAWPALCGPDNVDCAAYDADVWRRIQDAAAVAYDRTDTCGFTSLIGWEWSGGPGTKNLHRNVIFRNDVVPDHATSYFDAPTVDGLWDALDAGCAPPCDVLTIPHNSNLSDGLMFEPGDAQSLDPARRAAMEPLVELFQHKGSSECRPGDLGGDEACAFEKVPYNTLSGANLGIKAEGQPLDFVRAVLGEGLRAGAVNPYRYGFIASTDTHLGTPGLVDERSFPGHGGAGHPNRTEADLDGLVDDPWFGPGGLVAVWAEENSREGIFQALQRREVYATSGPRITLRVFVGDFEDGICDQPDALARADAQGVPMGGVSAGPEVLVWAEADPGTPARGLVGLHSAEVVKGWLDGDAVTTELFRVFGDGSPPPPGSDCAPAAGAERFCVTWTDPSPAEVGFWYVRVTEVPTCRWTTWACRDAGVTCPTDREGYRDCCDPDLPATIQERAWSSPVWTR